MRIAFHCLKPFYRPQMQPVFDLVKDRVPSLLSADTEEVIRFDPRILVVADSRYYLYRHRLPGTIVVWIRHGLADKNFAGACVRGADFACLSSDWFARDYQERNYLPRLGFWITGYVSMDTVLNPAQHPDPGSLNLPEHRPGRRILLYAPTWNRWMGSAEMVSGTWFRSLLDRFPQLDLVVRPHPGIREKFPHVLCQWRKVCADYPERAVMVEDPRASIYEWFLAADIMLSDASSVFLYYLAMDRPIILLNPPRRYREKSYCNLSGPEWAWRDCAEEVENLDELLVAVDRALKEPAEKSCLRRMYRKRIFGECLDGRAAERTADQLLELAEGPESTRQWVRSAWRDIESWRERNQRNAWKNRFYKQFTRIGSYLERYPGVKYRLNQLRRVFIREI